MTAGELRDWFATSTSRRPAVIAAAGTYLGSLTPTDLTPDARADRPALELAQPRPTISPDTPAAIGRYLVIATDAGPRRPACSVRLDRSMVSTPVARR